MSKLIVIDYIYNIKNQLSLNKLYLIFVFYWWRIADVLTRLMGCGTFSIGGHNFRPNDFSFESPFWLYAVVQISKTQSEL
jgi:hypothetical protein